DVLPRSSIGEIQPLQPPQTVEHWGDIDLQRTADRVLLARYAPPCVMINERLEVLYSRGRLNPFFGFRPGAATLDLLRLTPGSIAPEVQAAVQRAIQHEVPVHVEGLQVNDGAALHEAVLEVLPVHHAGTRSKCYLIVFVPAASIPAGDGRALEAPVP